VTHNSFFQHVTKRPQHFYGGDASYFAGAHEVRFGGGWRSMTADTTQTGPAHHLVASGQGYPDLLLQGVRDDQAAANTRHLSGYATDTISLDRITITGGVRFDRQTSSLGAASVNAVPGFDTVLPAIAATPIASVLKWTNVTPRVSATYAVDAERKTIVRGS